MSVRTAIGCSTIRGSHAFPNFTSIIRRGPHALPALAAVVSFPSSAAHAQEPGMTLDAALQISDQPLFFDPGFGKPQFRAVPT